MDTTPQSLLDRLRRDPTDQASWARLHDLYTPLLHRWLQRLRPLPYHDAEDLTQNILTIVVKKLPGFEHNQRDGAFRAWLRQILVKCLQEHFKKGPSVAPRAGEESLAILQDPHSDLARMFDEEHQAHVYSRLTQLAKDEFSGQTWDLFDATVLHQEPIADVAKRWKVTENVVYLARSRVLHWLRKEGKCLLDD